MELKNFFAQDDQGNKLPGATCYLYQRGTERLVEGLLKANGVPLSNPFMADQNGLIQFATANGIYDLRVVAGARDYRLSLQFGDVAEMVLAAEAAARQSESARDTLNLNVGRKSDIATGLVQTVPGQSFTVLADNAAHYIIEYENRAGVAIEIKRYPSADAVQRVESDTRDQRMTLTKNGMSFYKGVGPIHPLMIDAVNRILLGFDSGSNKLVGPGLLTRSDIFTNLAKKRTVDFKGAGPIYPLLTDANNRVLLGYNASTDKIIGAGLGAGSAPGGEYYPPLQPVPLPSDLRPLGKAINHYLFYGQSLATGATATTLLSTSQPYNNLTFAGGPRGNGNLLAFKPLVEDAISPSPDGGTNRGETSCSGAANYATLLAAERLGVQPSAHVILASTAAHGSYRIDQLNKAAAWYSVLLDQVRAAKAINPDYAVHAIGWMQGENDAVTGVQTPYATYRAALELLQVDMEADIKAITLQPTPVFFVTYQLSYGAATWPAMAKAHLDLAQKNPKFFLSTPMYQFPYAPDQVHLTNVGYKWVGAYFGRAYERLVLEGMEPQWINPISALRMGNAIRLRFAVPVPPLKIDSVQLAATTDSGFRVKDSVGSVAITSIAVEHGCEVVLTLASTPVGATTVRYALDYLGAGLAITGGASGNLRDSDPASIVIAGVARPLFNLCPHFELSVITQGGI